MAKSTKQEKKAIATSVQERLEAHKAETDAAGKGRKLKFTKKEQEAYLKSYKVSTLEWNAFLFAYSNLPVFSNADLIQRIVRQLQMKSLNSHTVAIKPMNAAGATAVVSLILLAKVGVNHKNKLHDFKVCFINGGQLKEGSPQFTTTREVERWLASVSKLLSIGVCVKVTLCEQLSGKGPLSSLALCCCCCCCCCHLVVFHS